MKPSNMNLVHLIGTIHSKPELHLLSNGRKQVKFTLTTQETYLDLKGAKKIRKNWHTLAAWGKWVQVLNEYGTTGTDIAIEGRIVSRFYHDKGLRKMFSEIEINDLIIL